MVVVVVLCMYIEKRTWILATVLGAKRQARPCIYMYTHIHKYETTLHTFAWRTTHAPLTAYYTRVGKYYCMQNQSYRVLFYS